MAVLRPPKLSCRLSLIITLPLTATSCGQEQDVRVRGQNDVQALLVKMSGGATAPRSWKDAKAGGLEPLPARSGGQLCRIDTKDANAGYLLIAGHEKQMRVVMLSGSPVPNEFIATLSFPGNSAVSGL